MSGVSQRRATVSKPLMERRRRARMNACFRELRALLTQARATTSCQSSKLEKAEILEFTVRHLRALHCPSTDNRSRFRAGYAACVREITCFFSTAGALQHRRPSAEHRNRPDTAPNPDPLTHTPRGVWRPWS